MRDRPGNQRSRCRQPVRAGPTINHSRSSPALLLCVQAFSVIPGLCGLVAGRTLQLKQRPLLRDATIYLLALGLLCVFFSDGVIRTWEASLLVLLYLVYLLLVFFAPGMHRHYEAYSHRKKMWLEIRRAVATGVRGRDLHQLRESFLEVDPSQLAAAEDSKHFVVEAAEQKERERKEQEEARATTQGSSPKSPSPSTRGAHSPSGNGNAVELQETKMMTHDSALGEDDSGVSRGSGSSRYETVDTEPDLESSQPSRHHTLSAASPSAAEAEEDLEGDDDELPPRPSDGGPHISASTVETGDGHGGGHAHSGGPANLRAVEAPPSAVMRAYHLFISPLSLLFDKTCVACEWDSPQARWWPLTFLVSFAWVSLFSFLISTIVGRWVARSSGGVSQSYFGLVLVAIGAEIPDLIQSVTVARRGYGSMAVANSCGSQITNILVGLGLPWFLADLGSDGRGDGLAGYVAVHDHSHLQVAAFFQFSNLTLFVVVLLLMAVLQNTKKAQLTKTKGAIFLSAYVICIASYSLYIFT